MSFKERFTAVLEVLTELLWRGWGIFLYIIGGSGTMGAIITGKWLDGIMITWGTLMLGIIGAVGYAIAITGKASKATVAKAAQDTIQRMEEQKDK